MELTSKNQAIELKKYYMILFFTILTCGLNQTQYYFVRDHSIACNLNNKNLVFQLMPSAFLAFPRLASYCLFLNQKNRASGDSQSQKICASRDAVTLLGFALILKTVAAVTTSDGECEIKFSCPNTVLSGGNHSMPIY